MNKQGWVLERKFSAEEIAEVLAFHEKQKARAVDDGSRIAAELMISYFSQQDGAQWVGMGHYELKRDAEAALEHLTGYRIVKATFPEAAKGVWWGYEVVEEVKA
jgi:hypothetical protein